MRKSFEEIMVEHCAPTLAGIKMANLFLYKSDDKNETLNEIETLRDFFYNKGIEIKILKSCNLKCSFLVYVYRIDRVKRRLACTDVTDFLMTEGYIHGDVDDYIEQLSSRLCLDDDFPHEIGIFLGYPLKDVKGFIENKGQNYTVSGHWKSYSNPSSAEIIFEKYRKCTSIYKNMFVSGTPLANLVAV